METKSSSGEIKIPVKSLLAVVAVLVVIAIAFFFLKSGFISGNAISEEQLKEKVLTFFATQVPDSTVEFVSATKQGSLYQINLVVDGQEVPIYATLDGNYLIIDPIPLE